MKAPATEITNALKLACVMSALLGFVLGFAFGCFAAVAPGF